MPFVTPDPRFPVRQGYPASDDTRNGLGPELETSPIVIVQDENARPFRYSFQTDYFCSAKGLARLVVSICLLCTGIASLFAKDHNSAYLNKELEDNWRSTFLTSAACLFFNLIQYHVYLYNFIGWHWVDYYNVKRTGVTILEVLFFITDLIMSFAMIGVSSNCWWEAYRLLEASGQDTSTYSTKGFLATAVFGSAAASLLSYLVYFRARDYIRARWTRPSDTE